MWSLPPFLQRRSIYDNSSKYPDWWSQSSSSFLSNPDFKKMWAKSSWKAFISFFFFCFSWFSTIFQAWLYNVRIPPYKIQCKRNSLDLQYLTYTLMTIWALFFQLIGTTWHLQYLYIQLNFFFKFNLIPNTNIQLAEQTIIIILTESPKSNFQPRLVLPWNIDLIVLRILLPKSALSEHYLHRQ